LIRLQTLGPCGRRADQSPQVQRLQSPVSCIPRHEHHSEHRRRRQLGSRKDKERARDQDPAPSPFVASLLIARSQERFASVTQQSRRRDAQP
jgi:hypothetical protein